MKNFQLKGGATVRVAYPQGLFEKRAVKGVEGDPKYNAILLIPKSDKQKIEQLDAAYAEAFDELRKKGFSGKSPKAINPKNNCYIDGADYADEADGREEFRDYMLLKVTSKNIRPLVTDKAKRIILNGVPMQGVALEDISDETLESGDYVFVNVSFWAYKNPAAAGIGGNLHALMRVAAGEHIGGASRNIDDYIEDFE